MAIYPFFGMRGTGDWRTNQRPENWRQAILKLYPNGKAPITAIMSMLKNESTDDPHYHWWTKLLANQRAAITGVFTNAALTVAYGGAAAAGTTVYVRMSADDIDKFKVGHQVMLRVSVDPDADVIGRVTARTKSGASSYIAVYLLEADDNSSSYDASSADVAWIVGSIHPEGDTSPESIMYDPVEYENYTQIFRTALEHTRTAMRTRLRTGDQVAQAKKEALELHGMEMEKAFIFGIKTLGTGDNGKPMRTTQGIRAFLSTHKYNWVNDGSGTWIANGEDWLDETLEKLFRFGSQEKLALCGSGALLGIQKLAKANGTFELTKMSAAYGVSVFEWVTAFGTLYLKTHPLFTYEATTRNSMLILDAENLVYRYIDDTKYHPNRQANDLDGEKSEYLTESGLELHHEETFGWIDGVGLNTFGTLTTAAPTTAAPTTTATTGAPTTTATTAAPTTTLTTAAPTTLATTAAPTTAAPTTA